VTCGGRGGAFSLWVYPISMFEYLKEWITCEFFWWVDFYVCYGVEMFF
jgi:hypothetical protein